MPDQTTQAPAEKPPVDIKSIQDVKTLNELEAAEQQGQKRPEVLKAIAEQRVALTTGDDEEKKLAEERAKLEAERRQLEAERDALLIERRQLEIQKSNNMADILSSGSALVARDLTKKDDINWLPVDLLKKGTRVYFYKGKDFRNYKGQKKVAVTFQEDGSAPFFTLPLSHLIFE